MENKTNHEQGRRSESYIPPRDNRFQYFYFSPEEAPWSAELSQQIQAQSYVDSGFVKTEGLITREDSAGNEYHVLSPDIANPSSVAEESYRTEYILGVQKATFDFSPLTGSMVTWRKNYAPVDALPTYNFCRDTLWPGNDAYLRSIAPYHLAEPEGLGKTKNAGSRVVTEFMRNEIQRVQGKGEVWFMGLVESTVFQMFVRNWGPEAVQQIGDPKRMSHPHINTHVALVPTVMDIDQFYPQYYRHIVNQAETGELTLDAIEHFVYMTDGVSERFLADEMRLYRKWAEKYVEKVKGDK